MNKLNRSIKILLGSSLCLTLILLSGCTNQQRLNTPVSTEGQLHGSIENGETKNIGVKSLRRARSIKKEMESQSESLVEDFGL